MMRHDQPIFISKHTSIIEVSMIETLTTILKLYLLELVFTQVPLDKMIELDGSTSPHILKHGDTVLS